MPAITTVVRRPLSSTTIVRASMMSMTRTMLAFEEGTSNETKRTRTKKQRFMGSCVVVSGFATKEGRAAGGRSVSGRMIAEGGGAKARGNKGRVLLSP